MKVAVLIGINYKGTSAELSGCINDIDNMQSFLKTKLGYDQIIRLSDDDGLKPTGKNIIYALYRAILKTRRTNVTELWIHYSGHGTYIKDRNRDEADGRDEAIVPLDYDRFGVISDDILHYFMKHANPKTKVYCFFDCCHAGTICDLPHNYIYYNRFGYQLNKNHSIRSKVTLFSGSMDHQTAADAWNVTGDKKYTGAMTSLFLETLKNSKYNLTYFNLLKKLSVLLKNRGFTQIPQISKGGKLNSKRTFIKPKGKKALIYY